MKKCNILIMTIFFSIICMAGPANSNDPPDIITFSQLQPYLGCLFYFDSASGQMRMCMPKLNKVQKRLERRNLTDPSILKLLWQAHINLMDKLGTDSVAARWTEATIDAGFQATEEFESIADRIEIVQDYYDLLDIRISQILTRNYDFVNPIFRELEPMFESEETSLRCIDYKDKYIEYLESLKANQSE